jgi:ankyrin repeat protein
MLEGGLPGDPSDDRSSEPIRAAAQGGDVQTVRMLLEAVSREHRPAMATDALYQAVNEGHVGVVRALVESGADVDVPVHDRTLLHVAAENNDASIIELLVGAGADVDAVTPAMERTALHAAATRGNTAAIRALLAAAARTDLQDRRGMTALQLARRHDGPDAESVWMLREAMEDTDQLAED